MSLILSESYLSHWHSQYHHVSQTTLAPSVHNPFSIIELLCQKLLLKAIVIIMVIYISKLTLCCAILFDTLLCNSDVFQ